jgi:nitroreductase
MSADPVDPTRLEQVVQAARWAPNAGNRRLQPVLSVTDPATREGLSPEMIVCLGHPAAAQQATLSALTHG